MKKILILSLVFIAPSLGFSQEEGAKFHCASPEEVGQSVAHCEDNGYIAEMASHCVSKYEAQWSAQLKKEKGGREIASFGSSSPEDMEKLKSGLYDLQDQAFLKDFVADVKTASNSVERYLDEVVLPEDFDEPEVTGDDMEDFLAAAPCYNQNISYIEASAYQMNTIATYLEENLQKVIDSAENSKSSDRKPSSVSEKK